MYKWFFFSFAVRVKTNHWSHAPEKHEQSHHKLIIKDVFLPKPFVVSIQSPKTLRTPLPAQ